MKVSDYIVSFLIKNNITDIFGYPGGMVTHLMDSLYKFKNDISSHVTYHEQSASFAACGYAQTSLKLGVAYATSGPGATNLITGIANAYFDSIPTLFLTGQVNTFESKGSLKVRQKGFQETDIINLVGSITKYCAVVNNPEDIRFELEKAYFLAMDGRQGPVVLDIPMDVQRAEIDENNLAGYSPLKPREIDYEGISKKIIDTLLSVKRPCILIGEGVNTSGMNATLVQLINDLKIPVVSSMIAIDALPESVYYYGFIGAYGDRVSNFILSKSDLIISLGSRLDVRQTGSDKKNFAVQAKLIRVDIDPNELTNIIKDDEIQYQADLKSLLPELCSQFKQREKNIDFKDWISICNEIKLHLDRIDYRDVNYLVEAISEKISNNVVITTDVGQNQVWIAQSFKVKQGQRVLFSGGHGAMGYGLPAAIGAHYGSGGKKVICFTGDGGLQMNIQELQFIARENLPIKIILFNNKSLGMIRHFQEMYFSSVYTQTKKETGYTVPNFSALAKAYGLPYKFVENNQDLTNVEILLYNDKPAFIEINLGDSTYVFPKLAMNKPNQDQEPELDRGLYNYISSI